MGIYSFIYQGLYGGRKVTVQLPNCVSNKFALPTNQAKFVIGEIDFDCFANAAGTVATLGLPE